MPRGIFEICKGVNLTEISNFKFFAHIALKINLDLFQHVNDFGNFFQKVVIWFFILMILLV